MHYNYERLADNATATSSISNFIIIKFNGRFPVDAVGGSHLSQVRTRSTPPIRVRPPHKGGPRRIDAALENTPTQPQAVLLCMTPFLIPSRGRTGDLCRGKLSGRLRPRNNRERGESPARDPGDKLVRRHLLFAVAAEASVALLIEKHLDSANVGDKGMLIDEVHPLQIPAFSARNPTDITD